MSDLPSDQHPEQDDLQRYADGEFDPAREAGLIAHVGACSTCRAEIDALRRVTALLCLSSAPPADLFERIKARRDAGELVLLPTGPPAAEPPPVATHTPATAAPPTPALRPWHRRRSWGWVVGPLCAAAAVLLVARLAVQPGRPGDDSDRTRGGGVEDSVADSTTGRDPAAADSARVARPDSSPATGGAEPGALVSLRETGDGLVIRLAAAARVLDPRQVQALDSAVRILSQDPARRAVIRYVDPAFDRASASSQLALRAADRFTLGGIDPARVRLVRVQAVTKLELPPDLDAIEVVVDRPRADNQLP